MLQTPDLRISIIGTGYVGLVTGLCLAEKGKTVICVDKDKKKIASINNRVSPIYENGINELLTKHLNKCFTATDDIESAIQNSEITYIAVGTPFDGESIDLSGVKAVAAEIGHVLRNKTSYHLIVVKSTVTPGTTDEVVLPILEKESGKRAGKDFGVCMNPEFLREGEAINDFLNPDRLVLGGIDEKSVNLLERVYCSFENVKIVKTSNKAAELIKYASNSLLATLISFSNEIANLCAQVKNVDAMDVMSAVCLDRRISTRIDDHYIQPEVVSYLKPGCGFGGSCFPKDIKALVAYGKQINAKMQLLEATLKINDVQPLKMVECLKKHYSNLKNIKVGILGLAFKPGTDDIRCTPSLIVINELLRNGSKIYVHDPIVKKLESYDEKSITFMPDLRSLVAKVDVIMVFTAWNQFRQLPSVIKDSRRSLLVIDGRRMFDAKDMPSYEGIGLSFPQIERDMEAAVY